VFWDILTKKNLKFKSEEKGERKKKGFPNYT
jgi:ribosomal protein S6E (S10)